MSDITVNDFVGDHLDDLIVVTGLPRSGTTILGKVVGSLDTVEYAFEPPLVPYLDAKHRHDHLPAEVAVELLRIYLYYDYFANYLHGRAYNFRPNDASYILDMQTVPEILEKWSRVTSMQDAVDAASEYTFSFKFPGVYSLLTALVEEVPDIRVIDIGRNLDRVVASLLEKRWFFDENLDADATGLWPFHASDGQYLVPYIVDEGDVNDWQTMTAESRTVYICNRLAEDRLAFRSAYVERSTYYDLRYEHLIESPETVTGELASFLDLPKTEKTQAVVNEIRPTSTTVDIDETLDVVERDIREQYLDLRPSFGL
jgi:hypothetical protein